MKAPEFPHATIQVDVDAWDDYELLDSGDHRKLERFGPMVIIRGEPRAWWAPSLPASAWERAVAYHSGDERTGGWVFYRDVPREWKVSVAGLTVQARFTATSKHVGIFPEHEPQWRWLQQQIGAVMAFEPVNVLNLFGYTGMASLAAAARGARVTHIDSSKGVVTWGKLNQQMSSLEEAPIRWIVDDAMKFVLREGRRGKRYDGIILDPPSFGRGPDGEVWKVEKRLTELLAACREILSDRPLFILLTMYSIDQSSVLIGNLLSQMMDGYGGVIRIGELTLKPKRAEILLPMSIYGRWSRA